MKEDEFYDVLDDHFLGVTKMVSVGSGSERQIEDFMLIWLMLSKNGVVKI